MSEEGTFKHPTVIKPSTTKVESNLTMTELMKRQCEDSLINEEIKRGIYRAGKDVRVDEVEELADLKRRVSALEHNLGIIFQLEGLSLSSVEDKPSTPKVECTESTHRCFCGKFLIGDDSDHRTTSSVELVEALEIGLYYAIGDGGHKAEDVDKIKQQLAKFKGDGK